METAVNTCYISVACNPVPHCLDWGFNNLICYGACNNVAIYKPEIVSGGQVICTLKCHSQRVNCVRWIKKPKESESEFVSASSDKTAVVWRLKSGAKYEFIPEVKLGHSDIVNVVDAVYLPSTGGSGDDKPIRKTLIATASSDCSIKIWIRDDNGKAECHQILQLQSSFALDLKWTFHPGTCNPLLIYGGSDTKIHLYAKHNDEFVEVMSLVGHEDWIRAVDVILDVNKTLLIASAAQDCLIRLWRIREKSTTSENISEIKLKSHTYTIDERSYDIELEAIMAGHENWVNGLHWHSSNNNNETKQLLSASMDKTMILWEMDNNIGVWIEKLRVGEVGGNTLGMYGNRFGPTGLSLLGHGYHGAFHLWNFNLELQKWEPGITVGGHFDVVVDIAWDPLGDFLISVSYDQTTRLHAPYRINGKKPVWHEMARPQVHGYDLTCVAMINRHKFASGADEKVLRAFEAPKNFIDNFARLSGIDLTIDLDEKSIPEGASVPALGLSNKAIFETSSQVDLEARHPKDIYPEAYFVSTILHAPPTEETLLQNTLWPEIHKMYGHGYEIFCVAANGSGTLLASACKTTTSEHAKILIWETTTWKEVAQMSGHSLTVTQMEFSPCGTYLLSISRDRTWSLFKIQQSDDKKLTWSRVAYSNKKTCVHARILWSCSWSHDGKFFVTGSRDKKVVIWGSKEKNETHACLGDWQAISQLECECSVTAVAYAPTFLSDNLSYLLAVGLENGNINLYKWRAEVEIAFQQICSLNSFHHLTVKRLRFRPKRGAAGQNSDEILQLASCGSDHTICIFNIYWTLL